MPQESDKPLVLVVDDEPGNLGYLNQILANDFRVRVALNGENALLMANSEPRPDLILLDIVMPGMDGLEACRRLKSDWGTKDIPVIFVTVRGEEADELAGLGLGAVDYITKPYSPPIVLARARTHVGLKKAREELARQNEALLESARLREAIEQITRHDLKNPLGAVLGNLDLLWDENLNPSQEHCLEEARGAVYRTLDLINLSLDIYKIENGTYVFNPERVNLCHVLETVVNEMGALTRAKKLKTTSFLDGIPMVQGDACPIPGEELLCYSMLGNLVKNAAEASPQGDCVRVDLIREKDMVRVDIHNRGAVPPEVREKFFEKYVTHGKRCGTGLGTYSARLLANLHEGRVEMATSDQEDSTTVSLLLPLWRGE